MTINFVKRKYRLFYKKDEITMDIDLDNLAREFNMNSEFSDDDIQQHAIDIEKIIMGNHASDPNKVLSDSIAKANAILDRVIIEINRSGMTPRLGEVASQLIQAINTAAGQLYDKDFNIGSLQLRHKMLDLKEREVRIKEKLAAKNTPGVVNQNLILTDRETVLKMIKDSREQIKLIESGEQTEKERNLNDE